MGMRAVLYIQRLLGYDKELRTFFRNPCERSGHKDKSLPINDSKKDFTVQIFI